MTKRRVFECDFICCDAILFFCLEETVNPNRLKETKIELGGDSQCAQTDHQNSIG